MSDKTPSSDNGNPSEEERQSDEEEKNDQSPEDTETSEETAPGDTPDRKPNNPSNPLSRIEEINELGRKIDHDALTAPLEQMLNNSLARFHEGIRRSLPDSAQKLRELMESGEFLEAMSVKAQEQLARSSELRDWSLENDIPEDLKIEIADYQHEAENLAERFSELSEKTHQAESWDNASESETTALSRIEVEADELNRDLDYHSFRGKVLTTLTNLSKTAEKQNQDTTTQWRVSTFVTVAALAVTALAISENSVIGEAAKIVVEWPWYITWPASTTMLGLLWLALAVWNSRHEHKEDRGRLLTLLVERSSWLFGGITRGLRWARILPRDTSTPEKTREQVQE